MGIQVGASTSLSAQVGSLEAVVSSVAYLQPEFDAQWIEVDVFATSSIPDVVAVDVVTPTDLVALTAIKSLFEQTSGFTDRATRAFSKGRSDSVTMEDDADIDVWIDKHLADLQSIADAKAIFTGKPLSDLVTSGDLAALEATKQLADILDAPTDAVANVIYKSLADSISFADAAAAFKLYIRSFADNLTAPDASVLEPQTPKTEIATASDSYLQGVDKNLSEGLNLIDNMDGDIEYAFIKVIGELLAASDAQVIDFSSQKADNMLTVSSGVIVMQDYCDITYFLGDYVGVARSFT